MRTGDVAIGTRPHVTGLQVSITDDVGRRLAVRGLAPWLARAAPARTRGTVTIAIVRDATIRRLNRTYRGKDAATDVLSFAAESEPPAGSRSARHLGDIAISRAIARKQAARLGHSEAVELRILALHGLLHLLGYDHEADQGEMATIEDRLRRRAGLPRGLIARTPRAAR